MHDIKIMKDHLGIYGFFVGTVAAAVAGDVQTLMLTCPDALPEQATGWRRHTLAAPDEAKGRAYYLTRFRCLTRTDEWLSVYVRSLKLPEIKTQKAGRGPSPRQTPQSALQNKD